MLTKITEVIPEGFGVAKKRAQNNLLYFTIQHRQKGVIF